MNRPFKWLKLPPPPTMNSHVHPGVRNRVALVPDGIPIGFVRLDGLVVAVLEVESSHSSHLKPSLPNILRNDDGHVRFSRQVQGSTDWSFDLCRYQVFLGEITLGVDHHIGQMVDPGAGFRQRCGREADIRLLVAHLQNNVVIGVDFLRDLGHVVAFPLRQIRVLKGLGILVVALAGALHIVFVIQGRDRPSVRVLGIEETDLYHDAPLAGLGDEIFQPRGLVHSSMKLSSGVAIVYRDLGRAPISTRPVRRTPQVIRASTQPLETAIV